MRGRDSRPRMKSISVTNAFKKDAATLAKRGYDRVKLDAVVRQGNRVKEVRDIGWIC